MSQKIVIISLMIIIVILLWGYIAFGKTSNTRTIMMYIVGSDFEVLDFPKTRVKLLDKNNKVIDG